MIQLSYRDVWSIYEQVKGGLRHLVATGTLQTGNKLPFVRALASSPAINPNTIQWAYKSLEREGYLHTVANEGSFVASQADMGVVRRDRPFRKFDALAVELLLLGMTVGELAGWLETAAW